MRKIAFLVLPVCLFFCGGLAHVHAAFEFDLGIGAAWQNYDDPGPGNIFIQMSWGYTSAAFETITRQVTEHERLTNGRRGNYTTEKNKNIEQYNFDIMADMSFGTRFLQGGVIFNIYLFTPLFFAIGIGAGGGYAVGYDALLGDAPFTHGPYIRATLPIQLNGGNMAIVGVFDYFFFETSAMRIGGYFKYIF
ncbi:hypothetical protein FACS1894151_02640 [Spirochaetia bacterium]|nr:hypothetical protein FACS1894151_02640 [Spirochaetia bacterium]